MNWPELPNINSKFYIKQDKLAFHRNSYRHQASAVSFQKFTTSYLFAYMLSEGNWHFHGWFCSVGFQKHFTDPWARCTVGPHHPCINLENWSSHISWITNHSPQVKHSDGVTKVNEHGVRNVILDANTCNQQLDVQSSLGWDNTGLGFIFCLPPSFIQSFTYCFSLSIVTCD